MKKNNISIADIILALSEAGLPTELHEQYANAIFAYLQNSNSNDDEDKTQPLSLSKIIERLVQDEPLEYILGQGKFHGLVYKLTKDTLIPRTETEQLVDMALDKIKSCLLEGKNVYIFEIGTGSGCISITLAHELADFTQQQHAVSPTDEIVDYENDTADDTQPIIFRYSIVATEPHKATREIALENLNMHAQNTPEAALEAKITIIDSDLLSNVALPTPLRSTDQIIFIANLPYISTDDYEDLDSSVKDYEPRHALVGGQHGHELYAKLFKQIDKYLRFAEFIDTTYEKFLHNNVSQFYEIDALHQELFANALSDVFGLRPEIVPDVHERNRFLRITI